MRRMGAATWVPIIKSVRSGRKRIAYPAAAACPTALSGFPRIMSSAISVIFRGCRGCGGGFELPFPGLAVGDFRVGRMGVVGLRLAGPASSAAGRSAPGKSPCCEGAERDRAAEGGDRIAPHEAETLGHSVPAGGRCSGAGIKGCGADFFQGGRHRSMCCSVRP